MRSTMADNNKTGKFFCARLGGNVIRAYNRAARMAQAAVAAEIVKIDVTIAGLRDSLNEVPIPFAVEKSRRS